MARDEKMLADMQPAAAPGGGLAMTAWTLDGCCGLLQAAGDTLRPGGLELTAKLLELGDLCDGSRILDAGCGAGATMRLLAGTGRLTAVGVDRSRSLLLEARRRSPESHLVCAALEKLPFAEGSFDGIVCECVLSQTPAAAVLAEFGRVLRPGGSLLISDLYRKTASSDGAAGPTREQPATGEQSAARHRLTAGDQPARREQQATGGQQAAGHHAAPEQPATREQTSAMLSDAGFGVAHWEDRTAELRQLAVRLIMAPGPARGNLFGWSNRDSCGKENGTKSGWKDVGYHLLVARRTTP